MDVKTVDVQCYQIDSGKKFDNMIREVVTKEGTKVDISLMTQNRAILERLRLMDSKQDVIDRKLNRILEMLETPEILENM